LEIRFQQLNSLLSEKAESLESTENWIFKTVAAWNLTEWLGSVEYSRKFGVQDLLYELDVIMKAVSVVESTKFKSLASQSIVRKIIPAASESDLIAIDGEIDKPAAHSSVSLDALNVGQQ